MPETKSSEEHRVIGERNKFSSEVRERAVRSVNDQSKDHPAQWSAICSIAEKIGCPPRPSLPGDIYVDTWGVEEHRAAWRGELICEALPVAPTTFHEVSAARKDSTILSVRRRRDHELGAQIQQVWDETFQVFGSRKVWRQLKREGFAAGRSRIEFLMRQMGLKGTVWGREGYQDKLLRPEHVDTRGSGPAGLPCHGSEPSLGGGSRRD